MPSPIEIERKFVIKIPDIKLLCQLNCYTVSEIRQDYLASSPAVTHRVRMRAYPDRTVYTETKKIRIDRMSVIEEEHEVSAEEYAALIEKKSPEHKTVAKIRHTAEYKGKIFEVDIYPEWKKTCILEVELNSRDEMVEMPPFIRIIKEVTGDKSYSNAGMAQSFPKELST